MARSAGGRFSSARTSARASATLTWARTKVLVTGSGAPRPGRFSLKSARNALRAPSSVSRWRRLSSKTIQKGSPSSVGRFIRARSSGLTTASASTAFISSGSGAGPRTSAAGPAGGSAAADDADASSQPTSGWKRSEWAPATPPPALMTALQSTLRKAPGVSG